ncbi:MAG TPA: lasso peptide biosynthesis B2 protein [Thermoleophilaceae bacterium]
MRPTPANVALAAEVVASYVRARRKLRHADLRVALADLRAVDSPRLRPPADPIDGGRRLGRAVARTLALLPGDTRCLTQSLVLTRLLAARGMESRLVIGVRPGERFAAHAWVEHDGVPLLPPGADHFEELVTL